MPTISPMATLRQAKREAGRGLGACPEQGGCRQRSAQPRLCPTCPYPAQQAAQQSATIFTRIASKSHAAHTVCANTSHFHTNSTQFSQTHHFFTRFSHDFRTAVSNITLIFMENTKLSPPLDKITPQSHGITRKFTQKAKAL